MCSRFLLIPIKFLIKKKYWSILPTYLLSFLLPVPNSMGNQLAKLQGDFLLERVGEEVKYSLLNWVVSFPILKGGRGIWKLSISNQVLIGRWLWLSGYKSSHLWRHVICVKKVKARISGCVQCWEDHIYLSLKSLKAWETFLRIVNFVLGGRRTIKFGMILVHWCIFVEGGTLHGSKA